MLARMDSFIGIITEDSPALLIGLLGILKSGYSFVPISPTFPKGRINYIITDCGITIILTDGANYETAREIAEENPLVEHIICIDGFDNGKTSIGLAKENRLGVPSNPSNNCYVIYTSGSTGRPKGVPITHRHLIPEFYWFRDYMGLDHRNRVLQNLSYTFDFGVFEIFTTILYGGCLYVVDKKKVGDFGLYSRFINKHTIDTVHSTPAFFNNVVSLGEKLPSLRIVHLGGERLTGNVVKNICAKVTPECKIHNGYGPTETTINCSIYTLTAGQCDSIEDSANIPIGRPTILHMLYILDRNFQPLPEGTAGELCIAGTGVAPGYLNNPELTAEKFQFNWSYESYKTSILYKTGDLVRWLHDGPPAGGTTKGIIEFLGRIDHQVKIRGYRIELGEIESCLLKHPGIKEAVVIIGGHECGGNYLCAYFVSRSTTGITVTMLREYLAKELPAYMIPAYFVRMERMPLTANGKADKKSLPAPEESDIETSKTYEAPVTVLEKQLVKIWQELLRIKRIGIKDDFFELGGDSILLNRCIAAIRGELNSEIPMRKFFERPFIKALTEEIEKQERQVSSIKPVERKGEIPLSFAQERLWFLQELDADNVAYFVPRVIRMRGKLDVSLLERTFTEIIRRHEILRTVFPTIDGQPVQRIQPPYSFKIPVLDWSSLYKEEREQKVSEFLSEEDHRAFDFGKGPLLRVTILKLEVEEHLFVLTEHHLVHDGWTQGVLLREFIAIFSAYANGEDHDLPELPIQYADFAIWQRNVLSGEVLERHLNYWKEKLSALEPILELPADRPRPPVISGKGELEIVRLSGPNTLRLKQFSRQNGATLFMTMLAVFKTLLYRYTGVEDLCVGTGIANRRYKEMEGMLGMVINTLPLRTKVKGEISFKECLNRVKETCLEAYQHEDTPFGKIVERLQPERSLSYSLIFQVMFTFMDTPGGELRLPGLELELLPAHNRSAKFDINVVVVPPPEQDENGEILVEWEYNTDIFDASTIERLVSHYGRLLEDALSQPELDISTLRLMSEREMEQVLYEFNDTERTYPCDKTICQLFEEQAAKTPDHIALVGASSQTCPINLSYGVLNEQVNGLAGLLIEKGVLAGNIAAILMKRSIDLIIAIMGILKAGCAYLPIDPESPEERVEYMLADSNAKILLGTEEYREKIIINCQLLIVNCKLKSQRSMQASLQHSNHLAYIIYTSGSTGKPKGVPINHANLCPLLYWGYDAMGWRPGDHVIQTLAYYFDWSAWEILLTLTAGASLYMISEELLLSPGDQLDFIKRNDITVMETTPTRFQSLIATDLKPGALDTLRCLCIGAEKLTVSLVKRTRELIADDCRVFNLYGPTEATIISGALEIDIANLGKYDCLSSIPIGKPVANSPLLVLNKNLNTCPINITGELYIAGDGVAIGYLNDPLKSSHSFIENRFQSRGIRGKQLYKTGDLVRWLTSGVVEFLGRIDYQVKVRGLRIELGEIESRLLKHAGVHEAVVIDKPRPSGDNYLYAYIVAKAGNTLSAGQLKDYLSSVLPDYMIPSYFIFIDRIPLNPNGKIDRKALPEPEITTSEIYTAPTNEIEKRLVELWAEILGSDVSHVLQLQAKIGIDDNFFELGGHSLKATILVSRIEKAFNVKIPLSEIFMNPNVRELAGYIKDAAQCKYETIDLAEKKEYYGLSSAQSRLFTLQEMTPESTAYNITAFFEMEGLVDKEKFETALRGLINRHAILRTSFRTIDGKPAQRVHDEVEFEIKYLATDEHGQTQTFLMNFIQSFDLAKAPLLRVGLVKESEERHILIVDMHHIISDGTSMNILVKDFMALYRGEDLPGLRVQYKDFSGWQTSEKRKETIKQQEAFWVNEFEGEIPVLELPVDYARPMVQSFEGSRINFEIARETTAALKAFTFEAGASLYMALLSIYTIFLSKLNGHEDIIVGSPTSGRRHADLEEIIGIFVNTLALRNYPVGEKTFSVFLQEVKEITLKAFENQDYQYEDLVERVVTNRDISRNPLFDTMFVLQNMDIVAINIPGLKLSPYPFENKTSKFDLTLLGIERDNKLLFTFEYCTKLFREETINRFIVYFKNIVNEVIDDKSMRISAFEITTEEEKKRLLFDFNDTEAEYPKDKTIHQLFTEQAERIPNNIALVGAGSQTCPITLSYNKLNEQSDRLAGILIEKGVQADDIVGIIMDRSIDLVIGILGILKAGSAYLPIDPEYPQERIDYMLKDSNAKILLGLEEYRKKITVNCKLKSRHPMQAPHHHSSFINHDSNHLAYIIYTSGSTGKPKGVMVPHVGISNRLQWMQETYHLTPDDRILQKTPYSFDVSVWEFFWTLLNGALLVMARPGGHKDSAYLVEVINRERITTIHFVPTMLNVFLETSGVHTLQTLKQVICSGEALPAEYVQKFFKLFPVGVELHNLYGPTEASVDVTFWACERDSNRHVIPIGRPVANTRIYILDRNSNIVPVGVQGELHIGGVQLARGYLNNPELTAEKFQFNWPYKSLKTYILYKTGDLARWMGDGYIEFLGRIDQQIKIRGFRVELGEIESRLLKHQDIMDATVLAKEDISVEKYLTAYFVSAQMIPELELKEYLSKQLPHYMIPTYIIQIEKIPLTLNGKIDRSALPSPEITVLTERISPRNKIEEEVAGIWSEVLSRDTLQESQLRESLGIHDNFFKLGGHSLKAMILASKLQKFFNVKVPLIELFKNPTVVGLSKYIMEAKGENYVSIEPSEMKEYYLLSSAQKRIYTALQLEPESKSYNVTIILQLIGDLSIEHLQDAFTQVITRHENLRTSFEMIENNPVQIIHDQVEFNINYCAFSGEVTALRNYIRPFDLTQPPLLRVYLMKTSDKEYAMMSDMSHLISDGVSFWVLAKELMTLYNKQHLPPLSIQYKDFSEWENRLLRAGEIKKQEDFWLDLLKGELPILVLPTDFPRPSLRNINAGDIVNTILEESLTQKLYDVIRETDTTLFIFLLTVYFVLLNKYTGQKDIVVGTVVTGRTYSDLQNLIGVFINMLPLRNYPHPGKCFINFLGEVKENTLNAFDNQNYPTEELAKMLEIQSRPGRHPLFDTEFAVNNIDEKEIEIPGLKLKGYGAGINFAKFDLHFLASENNNSIRIVLRYSTELFKKSTAEMILNNYVEIIEQVVENLKLKLEDINRTVYLLTAQPIMLNEEKGEFEL